MPHNFSSLFSLVQSSECVLSEPQGGVLNIQSQIFTLQMPLLLSRAIYANFLTHKRRSPSTVCILYKLFSPSKLLTGAVNAPTTQVWPISVARAQVNCAKSSFGSFRKDFVQGQSSVSWTSFFLSSFTSSSQSCRSNQSSEKDQERGGLSAPLALMLYHPKNSKWRHQHHLKHFFGTSITLNIILASACVDFQLPRQW